MPAVLQHLPSVVHLLPAGSPQIRRNLAIKYQPGEPQKGRSISLSAAARISFPSSLVIWLLAMAVQVRIPLKPISHSGGKPITVPGGNRSGVGAKRRWHFDVAKIDRNRQVESVRSEAEAERSWRGWGCGARGSSPLPRLSKEFPEREERFGLNRGLSQLPSQTGS
jgi:hypothetical protein